MQKTKIGWATHSSNPIYAVSRETGKRGWFCTHVSAGCTNCYAATFNMRMGTGHDYIAQNESKVEFRLNEAELNRIARLRGPARVFLVDMSDLFHPLVPLGWIVRIIAAVAANPRITGIILTKRPERMREVFGDSDFQWLVLHEEEDWGGDTLRWPLPNLWVGVSAEDQRAADERIPILLDTPAAVRWVSVEPVLGPVDLDEHFWNAERWDYEGLDISEPARVVSLLHWIVCGGESGKGYRPMNLEWARALRDQCRAAGVAFFMKQGSGLRPETPTGDPGLDLVREYPARPVVAGQALALIREALGGP
jgi:protein gp37